MAFRDSHVPAASLPLVVSFVGPSGAGKTTVIERLIPLVAAAGLRVGTVKHASHGHEVDRIGSDSWRHRTAGAEAVLLAGASGAVVFLAEPSDPARIGQRHHTNDSGDDLVLARLGELIQTHLLGLDVVLAEGFAPVHELLVTVQRSDVAPKIPRTSATAWIAITDAPSGDDEYSFDELEAIASRIVAVVRSRPAVD